LELKQEFAALDWHEPKDANASRFLKPDQGRYGHGLKEGGATSP
jgi:hypothetical protein